MERISLLTAKKGIRHVDRPPARSQQQARLTCLIGHFPSSLISNLDTLTAPFTGLLSRAARLLIIEIPGLNTDPRRPEKHRSSRPTGMRLTEQRHSWTSFDDPTRREGTMDLIGHNTITTLGVLQRPHQVLYRGSVGGLYSDSIGHCTKTL